MSRLLYAFALFSTASAAWAEDTYLPKTYTPHTLELPEHVPKPDLPTDNVLTKERIELGGRLFFDSLLSEDNRMACAACHSPVDGFSDPRQFSEGINGHIGKRQSMSVLNLAWKDSFFWDGRAKTLREQVLHPIKDPTEMSLPIRRAVARLNRYGNYKTDFEKAYGPGNVTEKKLALALENYLLSLKSTDSKYDDSVEGKVSLTEQEKLGQKLFHTPYDPKSQTRGASCYECHSGPLFTDHAFRNNGLNATDDLGRYVVTLKSDDKGKFVTPSLRNIELTAPYMHDGRFSTLEDVLDHYSSPFSQKHQTLDPALQPHASTGILLSNEEKAAIIAFLKTLTDPEHK